MNKIILFFIQFYQKYLTILSYGSCRYHPTCSSYAKLQFEHNSFFKALWFSTIRILRCNPLFTGGFDHPKVKCTPSDELNLEFKKIKVKYWRIPTDKQNICFIVRHNTKWDKE
jgi:putative membrane protein insertion efficiency factor